jgi:pyruvate formate lyase activating enzyme
MLDTLGPDVPLHFVRFHPAYRYTSVGRTPPDALFRARDIALEAGVHHVYLGNLYRPGVSDTRCRHCGTLLVERFGLTVRVRGLEPEGTCVGCGARGPIKDPFGGVPAEVAAEAAPDGGEFRVSWNDEVQSLHVVAPDDAGRIALQVVRIPGGESTSLHAGQGLGRIIVSRASLEERGAVIRWSGPAPLRFLPVLDRAHFPVFDSADPAVAELSIR